MSGQYHRNGQAPLCMSIRERTEQFTRLRQSFHQQPLVQVTKPIFSHPYASIVQDPNSIELHSIGMPLPSVTMRDWLHYKSAVEHSIQDISNAIERLCSEHERYSIVERQLGPENDMAEHLFTQIVGMFIATRQRIDNLVLGDSGTELHALCRNVRLALMAKLGRCAESLRKTQLAQANAIAAMELRRKSPIIKARHFSTIEDPTQTQQQLLDPRLSTLTDRNEELNTVNQSLEHVCGLLRGMQTMVIEQGSILDRIDYNLERAQRYVVKGNAQLAKAQKRNITQQSKVMFLLFLALLIFLLVLGIAVRASGHRNQ